MRIDKVNSVSVIKDVGRGLDAIKKHATVPLAATLSVIPAVALSQSLAAQNKVDFSRQSFDKTLEENYFNLPQGCKPDEYQVKSARSLYDGHDPLVVAPTGTGKTAIAYYAISKNMAEGKKTFYTTPLKALSNEKYKELKKIYGEENVGISTGDKKVNEDAPIVVMTTEIYRNMVFGDKFKETTGQLDNLKTVIFDELHYMSDVDRGRIWEQSIILSRKDTQILSLSATIGEPEKIADWMHKIRESKVDLIYVPPEKRHVPLEFNMISVMSRTKGNNKIKTKKNVPPQKQKISQPDDFAYIGLVNQLSKDDKIPAIFFVFSKKQSKILLDKFKNYGKSLNNTEEAIAVGQIIKEYKKSGKYMGETLDEEGLKMGYAIHNAGLLPSQKELVEELFQKKLVKVVLATGTLSAGINMPARTVVLSSTRIPTDPKNSDGIDGRRDITVNEFHQMGGRAGRRGIDKIGYVYAMSTSASQANKIDDLINSEPDPIISRFDPDYSFVTNYYKFSQDEEIIKGLLSKSYKTYDLNSDKSAKKANYLLNIFKDKKSILQNFEYLDQNSKVTKKGELISILNGYEQIPIVDMVYDKKLAGMTPAELAASVASMAATNDKVASYQELNRHFQKIRQMNGNATFADQYETEFSHQNQTVKWFVDEFDHYLKKYNEKMQHTDKFQKVAQDKDVVKHIYDWAHLNSTNANSIENWEELCHLYLGDYTDEGSLYKEITQTVDLLKQMDNIAKAGLEVSKTEEDISYYENLDNSLMEAIALLSKEPIQEFKESYIFAA